MNTRLIAAALAIPCIGVSFAKAQADDQAKAVRDAFRDSSTAFTSAVATGTFREYRGKNVKELELADEAQVEFVFEKPKYYIRLRYSQEKLETQERRIFFDGTMVAACDRTPNILPTGCETVLRNVENRGDGLARPDSRDFPWDPSQLANEAFDIKTLLAENPESVKWETLSNGDIAGRYPLSPKQGASAGIGRFVCAQRFGYNLVETKLSSVANSGSFKRQTLTWKKTAQGHWFVAAIQTEFVSDSGLHSIAIRDELEITDFEPNAAIDPRMFTLSVFEMPPKSRVVDRRPGGQIYQLP